MVNFRPVNNQLKIGFPEVKIHCTIFIFSFLFFIGNESNGQSWNETYNKAYEYYTKDNIDSGLFLAHIALEITVTEGKRNTEDYVLDVYLLGALYRSKKNIDSAE